MTVLMASVAVAATAEPPADAAFTAATASTGNRVGSATLAPVTGLRATSTCSAGAAPTHLATVYNASWSSSSVVFTVPGSTRSGDLLVVHILRDSTVAPTAPAGFSVLRGDTDNGIGSWVYQRVATATDAGRKYTWTVSGSTGSGILTIYRDAAGPALATESSGAVTDSRTATMPSVTAGAADSLLVYLIAAQTSNIVTTSSTTPNGMTSIYEAINGNTAFRGYIETRPATGATGERVANLSIVSPLAVAGLLLRPAPALATVDLAWTASASPFADGYQIQRDGQDVATLNGRTTATWSGTLPAGTTPSYAVRTTAGTWRSAPMTVSATGCP